MADWAEWCRQALQIGAGIWIQSAFLLSVGLTAGWLLRRRGPLFEAAVYRATLCAIALSAFLAVTLAGRIRPVWRIDLPAHRAVAASFASGAASQAEVPSAPHTMLQAAVLSLSHAVSRADFSPSTNVPVPSATPARSHSMTAPTAQAPGKRAIPMPSESISWPSIYEGAVVAWFAGCVIQLVWLLAGAAALIRIGRVGELREGSREARLLAELAALAGVPKPRLIVHPRIRSPFVAGVYRPMIVVPDTLADLDEEVARAVLSHELAHVAQRDGAWLTAFKIALALAWPQPLLHILCRRWLSASEHACDAWALDNGCSPRTYAECLVRMTEERYRLRAARALSLGLVPFRSLLGRRVQQVLNRRDEEPRMMSRRSRYVLAGFAVLIGGAAVFLVSASSNARAAGHRLARRYSEARIEHSFSSPMRQNGLASHQLTSVAASRRGGSMKRIGSRMLSTVAAVTGGLVQVSLPSIAAPAPVEQPSVAASAPAEQSSVAAPSLTPVPGAPPSIAAVVSDTPSTTPPTVIASPAGSSSEATVTIDARGRVRTLSADPVASGSKVTTAAPLAVTRARSASPYPSLTLAVPTDGSPAVPPSATATTSSAARVPVIVRSEDGKTTTTYLAAPSLRAVTTDPAMETVPAISRSEDGTTTTTYLPASSLRTVAPLAGDYGTSLSVVRTDTFSRPSAEPLESSTVWDGKVTMDFHHAPVDDALRALFRQSGKSFSIPDGISGTVTVGAESVSFETALKMIMRSCSRPLAYEKEDGVYYFKSGR